MTFSLKLIIIIIRGEGEGGEREIGPCCAFKSPLHDCKHTGLVLAPGLGLLNIAIQGEPLCLEFVFHLNPKEFSSSDMPSGCS